MAPNSRRRKIKSDAVCRSLLSTKNVTPSKKNLGAVFTEMPHMHQEKPQISEFLQGDSKKSHLQSILERNALDEFLEMSLSSHVKFNENNYVNVLLRQSKQDVSKPTTFLQETHKDYPIVPIPRRPLNYVTGQSEKIISRNELDELENAAFLKWRLKLADMQEKEKFCMTPFERNIQFWRQLWRVLEKSQVVFQILDVRNPNFYRSKDLESYVSEIHSSKKTILLLNKSDLVPKIIRSLWAKFFYQQGVPCLFFSAILSTDECNVSEPFQTEINKDFDDFKDDIMPFLWNLSKNGELVSTSRLLDIMRHLRDHFQKANRLHEIKGSQQSNSILFHHPKQVDKNENIAHEQIACVKNFEQMKNTEKISKENMQESAENRSTDTASKTDEKYFTFRHDSSFTVGFVGYPNVGKSSVMNALLGDKKVSVSRQPGKTKHFQTFQLFDLGLNLCDCPGLL
jgi:large subunit GTPase 1